MKVEIELIPGEVFTHRDDDGTIRSFPIESMNKFVEKYACHCSDIKGVLLKIEPTVTAHIRSNAGIEEDRLARLCEPYLSRPLLGILWGPDDKKITLIDGNHRYIKLAGMGATHVKVFAFGHKLWEQFIVGIENAEGSFTRRSGVLEHEQRRAAKGLIKNVVQEITRKKELIKCE